MAFEQWCLSNLKKYGTDKIKYDGKTYKEFEFDKFLSNNAGWLIKEFPEEVNDLEGVYKKSVLHLLQDAPKKTSFDLSKIKGIDLVGYVENKCVLVKGYGDTTKLQDFFFDFEECCKSEVTVLDYMYHKGWTRQNKDWLDVQRSAKAMRCEYLPFHINDREYLDSDPEILSTYIPPKWRLISPNGGPDSRWIELIDYLVSEDQVSKKLLLKWVYRSLNTACQTHLLLIGKGGIGKGLFVDELLKNLHGVPNYDKGKANTLETSFNSVLDSKTIVHMDEANVIGTRQHDVLKEWANNLVSIEKKSVDAKLYPRTASIILSSNHHDAINLDPVNSRRFFVPDLNTPDKEFGETKSNKFMKELIASFEDPQLLSNFYSWLKENYENDDNMELHFGSTWERAVIMTQHPAISFVVEWILNNKTQSVMDLEVLKKLYRKAFGDRNSRAKYFSVDRLQAFFKHFTWRGKRVAKVERTDNIGLKGNLIPINDFAVLPTNSETKVDDINA